MAARKIWGFEITTSPSGKNIWPAKLKKEAVRRIDEEGTSPRELAAELGAHECLVRKWHVAARRTRGDIVRSNGPAFAEVKFNAASASESSVLPNTQQARIITGGVSIEFPISIDEASLMKLLRAAGAAK